jgi:hypothetical protein
MERVGLFFGEYHLDGFAFGAGYGGYILRHSLAIRDGIKLVADSDIFNSIVLIDLLGTHGNTLPITA